MRLVWAAREQPLDVEGLWAEGPAASALRRKLLANPRPGLRVAESGDRMVVLGLDLPWVEGAIYLGREDNLYLPTLCSPNLPRAWLVARLAQLGDPPWALVPPARALGLGAAAVVS